MLSSTTGRPVALTLLTARSTARVNCDVGAGNSPLGPQLGKPALPTPITSGRSTDCGLPPGQTAAFRSRATALSRLRRFNRNILILVKLGFDGSEDHLYRPYSKMLQLGLPPEHRFLTELVRWAVDKGDQVITRTASDLFEVFRRWLEFAGSKRYSIRPDQFDAELSALATGGGFASNFGAPRRLRGLTKEKDHGGQADLYVLNIPALLDELRSIEWLS